jgi:hypothetical protein
MKLIKFERFTGFGKYSTLSLGYFKKFVIAQITLHQSSKWNILYLSFAVYLFDGSLFQLHLSVLGQSLDFYVLAENYDFDLTMKSET